MSIWLPILGGMLLGETLIVLTLYWQDRPRRTHVLSISVSYLILVALAMQPALDPTTRIHPTAHLALAVVAYVLGSWALWALVPRPENGEAREP